MTKIKILFRPVLAWLTTIFVTTALLGCGTDNNPSKKMQLSENTQQALTVAEMPIDIAIGGNSWIVNDIDASDTLISEQGITKWQNKAQQLVTYFYLGETGTLNLGLQAKVNSAPATLKVDVNGQQKQLTIGSSQNKLIPVGQFNVTKTGYQKVVISGIEKSGKFFPDISALAIGGKATLGKNYYVKDDFYWGRRGPSVHLQYQLPDETENYQWFYSEITVPEGQDTIGSYYMANGFNGGYFGMQVNSAAERRVLFSIWSPYQTDDPTTIPDEYKIELVKKGDGVYTGKFGDEGSGGQSYLKYDWKAGVTYGFLTRFQPIVDEDKTNFTSYFYDPKLGQWQLIASFSRPKTTTYLKSPYSFLENFIPGAGQFERMAKYTNQWVKPSNGDWQPMLSAKFTYDATARKEARVDYQGGLLDNGFYLKNTGFFSEHTQYKAEFTRQVTDIPDIELDKLP